MAEEKKIITAGDIDDKGGVLNSDVTEFDATQCLTKKTIIDSYKNVQVINDSFTNNQLVTDEAIAVLKMGEFKVRISCPEFTSSLTEILSAFHIVVPTFLLTTSNGQTTCSYRFFSIRTDYDVDTCGILIYNPDLTGNGYIENYSKRQTKQFKVNLTGSTLINYSYKTEEIIHGGGGATLNFPSQYHNQMEDVIYSGNYGVVTAKTISPSSTTYYKMTLDVDASTLTVSNNNETFNMVFKKTGEILTEI